MATITIRNLDEKVKRRLQVRAAINGRSMEAEAREALSGLFTDIPAARKGGLGTAIHKRFAKFGGVDLEIPLRQFSGRTDKVMPKHASESIDPEKDLGTTIRELFAPLGGVKLNIPPRRKSTRKIPTFD
jgi:antitoxin FitA